MEQVQFGAENAACHKDVQLGLLPSNNEFATVLESGYHKPLSLR